jgi:NADH dehydrogenase/NADH:ubiquinone oxidoreductase subunit G
MCLVELAFTLKPIIACATNIHSDFLHIKTNSQLVLQARENVLEFLLINHPLDCPICDQGGECDLQDQAIIFGKDFARFRDFKRSILDYN